MARRLRTAGADGFADPSCWTRTARCAAAETGFTHVDDVPATVLSRTRRHWRAS